MPENPTSHNQFAYSVSEISGALKRLVEDNFGHVRVRGEISGYKRATSGHAYLKLKDTDAVLDAVCWKGVLGKINFAPEDGLEVICTGRLTTYPGRSNYQLVIDSMEPAGVGALMALLEKRKAALAAEGLFDASRKKPLPFMPRVIGVVTSPTGAVIRDILHRLQDRFPCHVIVWPVLVQGDGAAKQITAAIEGFNQRQDIDLIIVARGGGSLEDLMAFNEEMVVRAAANSRIPLISAVGHETDTTLIDYAADMRAPTPTAAAEMAVPVRAEWLAGVMDLGTRLLTATTRTLNAKHETIGALARGLIHPGRLLENNAQRLDDWAERLTSVLPVMLAQKQQQLAVAHAKLRSSTLLQLVARYVSDCELLAERLMRSMQHKTEQQLLRLEGLSQLLSSLSPLAILGRGFVLVRGADGHLVKEAKYLVSGTATVIFADGERTVSVK